MKISVYEYELQEILKIWVFNLFCSNCSLSNDDENVDTTYRFVSELIDADIEAGIYSSPPNIVCGCNETLYAIKSHALYDLLDSLFDRAQNKKDIIINYKESEPPTEEKNEEETFDYEVSDEN